MDNLNIYNKYRIVPQEAKKSIAGGRLKGMTDINPMWRIKSLTEEFGPVGLGWYYDILEERIEEGGNGEKVAFVKINLYVNFGETWSKPITGTGGSSFVARESKGLYTSDECFKMALTDAISVACKALGIGADVYFEKDSNKYDKADELAGKKQQNYNKNKTTEGNNNYICSSCTAGVTQGVKEYSTKNFNGKILCQKCQKKHK